MTTRSRIHQGVFFLLCSVALATFLPLPPSISALISPTALLLGTAIGLAWGNPYPVISRKTSKFLLQASVVLLGFSIDLGKVIRAGQSGFILSLLSISSVFALGWIFRRWLKLRPNTGLLVSAGTAICGGSAIAAVSSAVDAQEEDISVAVGTVFLLNALALLLFPPIGHLLGLSQRQFGEWSGIAIHDIASVVSAGNSYGKSALETATAVKLSRVLFLVPVTFLAAYFHKKQLGESEANNGTRATFPWFAGLFFLASLSRNWLPSIAQNGDDIKRIAGAGFALCLFLIGSALTRQVLKQVGIRPLAYGFVLWFFISTLSLVAVRLH